MMGSHSASPERLHPLLPTPAFRPLRLFPARRIARIPGKAGLQAVSSAQNRQQPPYAKCGKIVAQRAGRRRLRLGQWHLVSGHINVLRARLLEPYYGLVQDAAGVVCLGATPVGAAIVCQASYASDASYSSGDDVDGPAAAARPSASAFRIGVQHGGSTGAASRASVATGQTERVTEEWSEPEGGVLVPPRPLPPPPDTGGLLSVLSYTFRICLTERWAPLRLGAVFALLLLSRTVGFATPVCFKWAVEAVGRGPVPGPLWQQPVLRALLAAGACRAVSGIARDLQSPMFQLISQAAGRRMAYHGLKHVLALGPTYHSNASTGALTRIVDRGTKSIAA
eukprot:CAMPEP_0206147880 /NCGR_PEP_ID=MMETSP1473-20131121/34867_1 /ASSEMBLY_ACC=CAM_ASM_001109 /TAXON_ID=1461547 /ORGANISM="Stichococcus sp, Strain RCC1054" /LENGTH=337 /DNA_ID=CAMNT_0053545001 /DNA_START=243 /DNA_END=1252 /DNA_ORIENTATION=+